MLIGEITVHRHHGCCVKNIQLPSISMSTFSTWIMQCSCVCFLLYMLLHPGAVVCLAVFAFVTAGDFVPGLESQSVAVGRLSARSLAGSASPKQRFTGSAFHFRSSPYCAF